jgi:DNA-binding response OmpR family regulator
MAEFDQIEVLLVDPNPKIREHVETVVREVGFSKLRLGTTLDDIKNGIDEATPDFLLCGADFPEGDICETLVMLRHGVVGDNPFLSIAVLSRDAGSQKALDALEWGADFAIGVPSNANALRQHLETHFETRHPFIVTTEYMGPDRRQDIERASKIAQIKVPHIFKAKARGESLDGIHEAIEATMIDFNTQKLARHVDQVDYLIKRIGPNLMVGEADETVRLFLEKLMFVAQDLGLRVEGTPHASLSRICRGLYQVTDAIHAKQASPRAKDVKLLLGLAQKLATDFSAQTV